MLVSFIKIAPSHCVRTFYWLTLGTRRKAPQQARLCVYARGAPPLGERKGKKRFLLKRLLMTLYVDAAKGMSTVVGLVRVQVVRRDHKSPTEVRRTRLFRSPRALLPNLILRSALPFSISFSKAVKAKEKKKYWNRLLRCWYNTHISQHGVIIII